MIRLVTLLLLLAAWPALAFCPAILSQYAYIHMLSSAEPTPAAAQDPIWGAHYAATEPDGMRLKVRTAQRQYFLDGYDWEVKPLIDFVASDLPIAAQASLQGSDWAFQYAGPLLDRLISVRLIQALLVSRGLFLHEEDLIESGVQAGPAAGEVESDPFSGFEKQELIFDAISETLSPTFSSIVDLPGAFQFSLDDGEIKLSGRPDFYYWEESRGEVVPNLELFHAIRKISPELEECNPTAMRAVVRAFRITAFLRYLRHELTPQNWQRLVEGYERVVIPVVRPPQGIVLPER